MENKEKCMEAIKNASCIELTTIGRYICTLIIALFMTLGHALAHEDFYVTKEFGNVKVRIRIGFECEEINNVTLLGQLAEKLCIKLNYKEPIFLDFGHDYIGNLIPDFYISYNKVNNEYLIEIRQIARHFQAQTTLKLLEYAIMNYNNTKSIDTLAIKEALNTPNSELLNSILKQKIYRPEKNFEYGISYYLQNNRYVIFQKSYYLKKESDLIELDNIFDIKQIDNLYAVIFDSDTSFYYAKRSANIVYGIGDTVGKEDNPNISKRQVIEDRKGFQPFKVTNIDRGTLAITFDYFGKKDVDDYSLIGNFERTLIYFKDEDQVIQDLDKLIKK